MLFLKSELASIRRKAVTVGDAQTVKLVDYILKMDESMALLIEKNELIKGAMDEINVMMRCAQELM